MIRIGHFSILYHKNNEPATMLSFTKNRYVTLGVSTGRKQKEGTGYVEL